MNQPVIDGKCPSFFFVAHVRFASIRYGRPEPPNFSMEFGWRIPWCFLPEAFSMGVFLSFQKQHLSWKKDNLFCGKKNIYNIYIYIQL